MTKGILISRENLQNLANIDKAYTSAVHHSYFKNYKRIYRKVLRVPKALNNQNRIEKAANKRKE